MDYKRMKKASPVAAVTEFDDLISGEPREDIEKLEAPAEEPPRPDLTEETAPDDVSKYEAQLANIPMHVLSAYMKKMQGGEDVEAETDEER
jgi:hypothetical protein